MNSGVRLSPSLNWGVKPGEFLGDCFRTAFAVTLRLEPVGAYAYRYQVVGYGAGAAGGEVDVIFFRTPAVGVRCHFDCYVRVVAEHLRQLVEGCFGFGAQGGFVEIVENIVDYHRLVY